MIRSRRSLLLAFFVFLAIVALVEGVRVYRFYDDLTDGRTALLGLRDDLELGQLNTSQDEVSEQQRELALAAADLRSARTFSDGDAFIRLGTLLPLLGEQALALRALVAAAAESAETGLAASDIALAFATYERPQDQTSLQAALTFLARHEDDMALVQARLEVMKRTRGRIPDGTLIGPLASARANLDEALRKLDGLVEGYRRANTILPELFGMNGPRDYLLLPQNETELFPSGGLISSYGIANFEAGNLTAIQLEYFGGLFDRWQRSSGGEYIEPPPALKSYLKQGLSWGLGEAGWYPDFAMTAGIARDFVEKGGAPRTDGTIAFDLQFVEELLRLLGPAHVPDYNITITADNLKETTLEMTRDEAYVPGSQRKAFLSYLARGILSKVFTASKSKWVELLQLLDRMGRERHLQLHFEDDSLQAAAAAYGLDGAIITPSASDYLLIADSSVNSTKLNLILEASARLDIQLLPDGRARSMLTYRVTNPFPRWASTRDPALTSRLMHEGVYGAYLRLYTPPGTRFEHLTVNGVPNGLEQSDIELDKQVFGRFFTVLPGATSIARFTYASPSVVTDTGDGVVRYRLYLQKQAGTRALPIELRFILPPQATLVAASVDGSAVEGLLVVTDLRQDREIEVSFKGGS